MPEKKDDNDKGKMTMEEAGLKGGESSHNERELEESDEEIRERVA
ncbi:MAG TPA: hypothetical protein VFP49_10245 [Nitrososphaeraceae archaeon]|nr:hypothetical protein [Nitrososphaeraceae archaeon]